MVMSDGARQQLASMQAQLVRALVEGTDAPAAFDHERLEAAAEALLSKRARAVARVWPQLARAMKDDFAGRFTNYARANPLPCDGSPLADGRVFIDWLERAGLLTDEGRFEALAFDAHYRLGNEAVRRRRGPVLRARRLDTMHRLIIVVRLPLLGERWLHCKIL